MTSTIPAGWYPDPTSGERQRHFDGTAWSPWVFSAAGMTLAPMDVDVGAPGGVDVTRVILKSAAADGVVTQVTLAALLRYTEQYETPRVPTGSPTGPGPSSDSAWVPDDRHWNGGEQPQATAHGRDSSGPLFPAKIQSQGPASRWWQQTRETVKSDLAVHGLAYLGVLLLFAGVFGLVVWSFSDINTAMRPVAELAIPGALFAGAAMLKRRGTQVVAGALEVAGGLLLPIVAVASFVDGAPVPPDPGGVGLTVGLAVVTFAISCTYAVWVRFHPTSALAYLVAPVMWLALGLLSLSWLDPIPTGESVSTPRATEVAVMTAAAGVTLLLARVRPAWPLAQATLTTGPTALGVLAVLALLAGANDGWASTPAVVTAAGVVLGLEALATRLPGQVLTIASSVSVGLGLLAARSGLEESPWIALLAFAAATFWADLHRRQCSGRERRSYAVPTAVFPLGSALALVTALGWPAGMLGAAALLLAGAFASRVARSSDLFWTRWLTGAVGALAVGLVAAVSVDLDWPADASTDALVGTWQPSVTCALLAAALFVTPPRRSYGLPWALVALSAEAWAFAVPLLDSPTTLVVEGWACGASAIVVLVEVAPRQWLARVPTRRLAHVELASLALGLFASMVAVGTPSMTSATLAFVAGTLAIAWATVSAADELRGSAAVGVITEPLAGRAADQVRWVSPFIAAVATVVAVFTAVEHFGWVTDDDWWPTVPVALAALFIGLAHVGRAATPRLARVALEAWLLLSVVAAVTALTTYDGSAFAPTLTVLFTVLVLCAAVPRQLRDARPAWLAWTTSAAVVLVLSNEWMGTDDPHSRALLVWGSVALLLGLTVERLPHSSRLRLLTRYTLPPIALGGVGLAIGALITAATEDTVTTGRWFLLVALVCLAAAMLSGEGALIGTAALAITVSYASLAPWDPVANAWTLVACGGVWLLAADAARAWPWMRSQRYAIPSLFWSGQIVIVATLPLLVDDGQRPLGLALAGLVAIGIALRVPVPAARSWYASVGLVLVLVGAADAGPGWLAAALAALSAASTTASALGRELSQRGSGALRWLGAVSAAAAWVCFTVWAGWSDETSVIATAVTAGLLAAGAGVAAQLHSAARPWVEAWGGVALIAAVTAGLALATVPREPAGQMVAGGLVLSALGAALAAGPLGRSWLRVLTVVLSALAVTSYLFGTSATSLEVVIVAAVIASGVTVATAFVAATGSGTAWQPALFVAIVLSAGAVVLPAVAQLPDTTLLAVSLAVVAAQCIVAGRVVGSPLLLMLGPPLLAASWMLYASAALSGNPQWYLVPIGLSLIAMAALLRSARRKAGKALSGTDVVALELAGVVFVAGASLIQMATDSLGYVLVALAEGAAFALWGAVTKVRRRLAAGVGVVVAAVVLLVAIPLTPLLPQWQGAALWVGVAALGLAAIVIATFIERGRAAVGVWVASLSTTMSGWE